MPIEASSTAAPLLLERLTANLRAWNDLHPREFYLTMSTGAAILEGELSKDVHQLLSEADSQLYQQKRSRGRAEPVGTFSLPFWGSDSE